MEPRTLTYRRSWLVRVFPILLSLIALGGLPALLPTLIKTHQATAGMWWYYMLICIPFGILCFWGSGPNDIYFDRDQKTYRYIKGFPFVKTRTGPLSDLWGVYIGRTQGSGAYFCVGVTWWGGKGSVTLEAFSDRMKAEQFAAVLRAMLELKEVMPPRNLRPRT